MSATDQFRSFSYLIRHAAPACNGFSPICIEKPVADPQNHLTRRFGMGRRILRQFHSSMAATSSQLMPAPRSTFRGTSSARAVFISCRTSPARPAISPSGASKTSSSWIWRIIRAWRPWRNRRSILIMAILMRSAADPWITVLTAVRSARLRFRPMVFLIPEIGRRRPRIVSTRPAAKAASRVRVMNWSTPAYSRKYESMKAPASA